MALSKNVVQVTPREVIIKYVGSGTDTIDLTTLTSINQTVDGTPFVAIIGITTSLPNAASMVLTRNSVEVFRVHESYEFQTDGIITAVVDEQGKYNIVVNITGGDGTAFLRLRKISGYSVVS